MDVFERVLYNGFLGGMSVSGNQFFYVNPMASNGINDFGRGTGATRHEWFGCACCPTNVTRFLPSLPGYVYATKSNELFVNLFMDSESELKVDNASVKINQKTNYPWDGNVKITVTPSKTSAFPLSIRIPGWANAQAIPGDLYTYQNRETKGIQVTINGKNLPATVENGYLKLSRTWKSGDVVNITLDMPVRKVLANQNIKTNNGKVAIERGPVLYCAEGSDNNGKALSIAISNDQIFNAEYQKDFLGGLTVLKSTGNKSATLIPYYAWANRGANEMTIWFENK